MKYTKDVITRKKKRIEIRRKIMAFFVYIIILPIIFYNISLIIVSLVNPEETPSFFGVKTYVIISGSMQPNLNIGDMVFVKKCDEKELKVDDIISFREGQNVVTHRIVEINETHDRLEFVTKGDNNNVKDSEPVKYEDIEGKYLSKVPYVGNVIIFLKNKVVIISIILIFYLIYSHDLKISEKEKIRRRKRQRFEIQRKMDEL